ncbi:MAG: hypothetical protein KJ734_03435, partial [Chloroflexi bacterium]|nr:hypothetical protein [Chloroflexota bacterium]
MSEYQYYEFQALDRPLTDEEQQVVASLSSRMDPHPRRAVFVYNYGDFRGRPAEVLARYYDAMLYMANWGSRRLMFRFPQAVLDLERARDYCQPLIIEDYMSFYPAGEHIVLDIEFHDEEGGGEWLEGEGWLDALVGLREDILQGDYRALYLAWLRTLEVEDLLDEVAEPPVPPGLRPLSPALRRFSEFFELDEFLVQAAAQASGDRATPVDSWLPPALAQLPARERDDFLLRLAQGEPYLSAALNRRLRELVPRVDPAPGPRRTVGQLLALAEEERERVHRQRAEEAAARRLRELEALAQREDETWREVDRLIQQATARSYEDAVQYLVQLRDLAHHQHKT